MGNALKHAKRHCYPTNINLSDRLLLSELRCVQWLLRNVTIGYIFEVHLNRVTSTFLKSMIKPSLQLENQPVPSLLYIEQYLSLRVLLLTTLCHWGREEIQQQYGVSCCCGVWNKKWCWNFADWNLSFVSVRNFGECEYSFIDERNLQLNSTQLNSTQLNSTQL